MLPWTALKHIENFLAELRKTIKGSQTGVIDFWTGIRIWLGYPECEAVVVVVVVVIIIIIIIIIVVVVVLIIHLNVYRTFNVHICNSRSDI
jgi:hypothetical protein